ncbi:alkaline phosphatase [Neoconidiobolus thromboides FSU 785]|nr:alkaline phosphatase [Neoconidiobolus thromboides FSU 785]
MDLESNNNNTEGISLINNNQIKPSNHKKYMSYCVGLILVFIIGIGIVVSYSPHYGSSLNLFHFLLIVILFLGNKRNVIIMISDGFGPASETYGRTFHQFVHNNTYSSITPLDQILIGQSRTRSSSSVITDSAAGATAFSCGLKSYNGAIGVDQHQRPCGTVLEAAKKRGFLTGLVATSRITHATPASFSAHVISRDMENKIAEQQIGLYPLGRNVDIMFGGGKCEFLDRNTTGSCRSDNLDLIKKGNELGWNFVFEKKEFEEIDDNNVKLPLAGLFANGHMDYEIDRDSSQQPALKEMAKKTIQILNNLTKKKTHGFFLMIEGSRIDMAAHDNDPVAHAHDILAYYETVKVVKDFVAKNSDTVMISVSDHETGGFTLGRQLTAAYPEYIWHPEVIARVKKSTEKLAEEIMNFTGKDKANFIENKILQESMGISDPTEIEIEAINHANTLFDLKAQLGNVVSRRANLGWTTHGHTGVDVNLYAYGKGAHHLHGSKENTDIGKFIETFLDLDLTSITKKLKKWRF